MSLIETKSLHFRYGSREVLSDINVDFTEGTIITLFGENGSGQVYDFLMLGRKPYFCCVLSGGERQKVIIAKTLVQSAPVIFLDEPTSSLDLRYQVALMSLIRNQMVQTGGYSFVLPL